MADVITRFKLETTQYDSKLRDMAKGLQAYGNQIDTAGKDFTNFSQKAIEAARSLGTIASGATNTKDKLRDLVGAYNDVAKTYNKLTELQRQTDFGKNMAASLEQLQVRIRETKQELYSGSGGEGLFGGGKLGGMLQVFGGNLMTKAADAAMSFAAGIAECAKQGIELAKQGEGVYLAFQRLNQPGLLDNLRQATHGTVTNLELMKAAVKFNDFKLPLEELGTMLAFAQQKAKDTGQSVDYMVDSIVTGLGRKSLMILDNLGLSAAEIKERMAETGDMTKAVGEIIRDQMQKAGDYVETAADRATSANVELTNAMTELGNTLLPLQEAGESVFTGIQIAALQLLNDGVKPMVPVLVDIRDAVSDISKVSGTAKSTVIPLFQGITGAAAESLPVVGKLAMLINIIRGFSGGSDSGDMGASVGALGLPDATINEIPEIQVLGNKPKKKPRGGGNTSSPSIDDFNKALAKSLTGSADLKQVKEALSPYEMMLPEIKKNILDIKDADLGGALAKLGDEKVKKEIEDTTKKLNQEQMAFQMAGQAAASFGAALAGIEDPSAKAAGTVLQAIANVALGFGSAVAQASSMGPYAWIAYTAAAIGAMATAISTVHSLTGYAQGGIVEGNSYSGDNMMFGGDGLYGLNSGELVLTKAQQGNLASQLSGGAQNLRLDGIISGENIHIVHNRYLKRTGQGELLTWG